MKRYLLFCFENYYPGGGTNDLQGSHDSVMACVISMRGQNANILDTHTGRVIHVPGNLDANTLIEWAQSQDQSDWQEI
jgi:hypothetical protein